MQPYPQNPYAGPPPGGPAGYPPPPGAPRPRNSYKRPLRVSVNIICGALLIMLLMMYSMPQVFYAVVEAFEIAPDEVPELIHWLVNASIFALSLALPIVFIQVMGGVPARVAYPMRALRANMLLPGLFLFLGVTLAGRLLIIAISLFFTELLGVMPYTAASVPPAGAAALVVYMLHATLLPAVLEELLFRGVIMQSLRRYGDAFALVISSLLFGIMHRNMLQTPNAILLGFVIGYFVLRTGSLLTGMVFHFVNNALSLGLSLLTLHSMRWGQVAYNLTYPLYILLGVIGLLWLQTTHGTNLRLMPSAYPLRESGKYGIFFSAGCAIVLILACFAAALLPYARG